MRKIRVLLACLFAAIFAVVGCTGILSEESEQQVASASEPQVVDPKTAVYQIAPMNNTPEAIRRCNREPGSGVLMTFDDYGTPQQVQAILNKLRFHKMRAAFFPTGEWAIKNHDLIVQMRADGHMIGNHTHTHANLKELSDSNEPGFYGEIYPVAGMINTSPQLLRPPYGAGANDVLVGQRLIEKGIQICTWTADTLDWKGGSVDEMMDYLRKGNGGYQLPLGPDAVILAHMQHQHTPELIDAVVKYLGQMGWTYERTS